MVPNSLHCCNLGTKNPSTTLKTGTVLPVLPALSIPLLGAVVPRHRASLHWAALPKLSCLHLRGKKHRTLGNPDSVVSPDVACTYQSLV